jgi:hypothetical protein
VDVRLPDGTVIKGVPDGISKADLTAKLKANGYDVSGFAETKAPKPEPTAGDRGQAALGGVNRGIAGLAGLPVDTVENIINLGIAAYGTAKQGITGKPGPDLLEGSAGGSKYIADKLQGAGVNTQNPRPDDAASRMLFTGGTIAGGSMVPGAGVKNTAAAVVGGSLAGEALGPEYTGVGAMAPGAVSQSLSAAKAAVANPRTVQENVETFKKVGTTPDVAQATDSNFFRGLTNVVARIPGGQGVVSKFREKEQEALGKAAQTGTSAEAAGRAIKSGITGDGGFIDRTKAQWVKLDDEVAAKVGSKGYKASPCKYGGGSGRAHGHGSGGGEDNRLASK